MTQYYSRVDATLNGDVYNIPFSYIKENEISVYIDDEPITSWEFLNESQIKINEIPSDVSADAIVSIRRTTDITKKVVDYTNQSMLKKENLNLSQNQILNAVQEVYDNSVSFEIDTTAQIATNKAELETIIQNNKEEVLGVQQDFETEVNTKIEQVTEAAEKINNLEEAVNTALAAANTATEKADEAQEIVNNAVTEMNSKLEAAADSAQQALDVVADLDNVKADMIAQIQSTGFYMRDDKLYYVDSEGQEQEFKNNDFESIVPYTLFDSKYSEAKQYNASWVLRGSTLSKSVYPTAYEAALVEYNSEVADGTTVELPSGGSYTKRGVSGGITVKLSTDETVTEYDWKLDTVAETLTVPTLNGSEDLLSDRYDDLELKASGSTYTAPANGWFWIQKLSSSTGQFLTPVIKDSNGNIKYTLTSQPTAAGYDAEILAPVSKGDVISIGYSVGGATQSFRFIYAKSNGSLYFFVASVAHNAPLANLGRIEETKVDKNSSWGFPSNRYIDLELGASGSTYTAPANGYFCWNGLVNDSYIVLTIGATDVSNIDNAVKTAKRGYTANSASLEAKAFVAEVAKNTVIHVWFGGFISGSFKFIFAEGSN